MVRVLNSLVNLFQTILVLSISGTLLCGVIILVKTIAGRRMSSRSHSLIWLFLILALLLPVSKIQQMVPGWAVVSIQINQLAIQPITEPTLKIYLYSTPKLEMNPDNDSARE